MRYRTISKECAERLSDLGYVLSDGDQTFIDELTMMVLTENTGGDYTDEEIIQRIIPLAKLYLDPIPEKTNLKEQSDIVEEAVAAPSLWNSVVRFIFALKQGPKD